MGTEGPSSGVPSFPRFGAHFEASCVPKQCSLGVPDVPEVSYLGAIDLSRALSVPKPLYRNRTKRRSHRCEKASFVRVCYRVRSSLLLPSAIHLL